MTRTKQASKSSHSKTSENIYNNAGHVGFFIKVMCIRLNNSLSTKISFSAPSLLLVTNIKKQSSDSRCYIPTLNQKDHLEFQP